MEWLLQELRGRGVSALIGLLLGGLIAWLIGGMKRRRERQSILAGDARDTIVIHQHIIETVERQGEEPAITVRVRCLGQSELSRVVPNGHLAAELQRRAFGVTSRDTLISMQGAPGSFLLETLTNFVCDRVANAAFEHDLYIMAPCCEPAELAEHQPIAILLVPVAALPHFEDWPRCRGMLVEHGSDGARLLTLRELARRYRAEQQQMADLRRQGQRTRYVETMYILDLALDKRAAPIPLKAVPWGRYEDVLKQMNLE